MVNMSAGEIGGKTVTEKDIMGRPPEMLPLPVRNISGLEAIVTGFRMSVLYNEDGGVATHGGCGSRFAVTMSWKGRHCCIEGLELLVAWVETWDPAEAKLLREATVSRGPAGERPAPIAEDDGEVDAEWEDSL